MNTKKIMYLVTAFLTISVAIFITSIVNNPRTEKKEAEEEVSQTENNIGDVLDSSDGEDENSLVHCTYTNMDILSTEYLPYGAFHRLNEQTSEWLDQNGFKSVTSITIIERTIVADKNKPSFSCILNDSQNKTIINIYYDVIEKKFIISK